jgi:hypothetical protein
VSQLDATRSQHSADLHTLRATEIRAPEWSSLNNKLTREFLAVLPDSLTESVGSQWISPF